jgi:hypothetical protein
MGCWIHPEPRLSSTQRGSRNSFFHFFTDSRSFLIAQSQSLTGASESIRISTFVPALQHLLLHPRGLDWRTVCFASAHLAPASLNGERATSPVQNSTFVQDNPSACPSLWHRESTLESHHGPSSSTAEIAVATAALLHPPSISLAQWTTPAKSLVATVPLLSPDPSSILFTEPLLYTGEDAARHSITQSRDISATGLPLDLAPVKYLSNFHTCSILGGSHGGKIPGGIHTIPRGDRMGAFDDRRPDDRITARPPGEYPPVRPRSSALCPGNVHHQTTCTSTK